MRGDAGPYMNEDGDVWVPRTEPYLRARRVAATGKNRYDDKLVYIGKTDAILFGFTRDCFCDESCEMRGQEAEDRGEDPDQCLVPAWHFRVEER